MVGEMNASCDSYGAEAPWSLWLSDGAESDRHDSSLRSSKNGNGFPAQMRQHRKKVEERSAQRLKHSAYHADLRLQSNNNFIDLGQRHRRKLNQKYSSQKQRQQPSEDRPGNCSNPEEAGRTAQAPLSSASGSRPSKQQASKYVDCGPRRGRFQQRRVASAFHQWSAALLERFGGSGHDDAVQFLKSSRSGQAESQEGLQQLCEKLGLDSDDASLLAQLESKQKPTVEQLVDVGMSIGNSLYPGIPRLLPEQVPTKEDANDAQTEEPSKEAVITERKKPRKCRPWHASLAALPQISSKQLLRS
eukprot:gnl/MRDRNA2_/MRDRNA2_112311_c0_seq1.p1 gnl/MRDRNA2_/MRDRNA2_112311_c0~~gnl/MRDRNA2_/MRDRNA2_112311_c0_seq1.p1  ORF type:complete len:303 (+),score=62.34 gnl/MRDRNA2_/MRDRNA2_112311_c0_seq1:89-997(+)